MSAYWPWWLGALGLSAVTVLSWLILGRLLGVSGSWGRLASRAEERALERVEAPLRRNAMAMEDALLAATLAQFGEQATYKTVAAPHVSRATVTAPQRVSLSVHLTFLLAMAVGGFAAAAGTGQLQLHFDLGAVHTRLFGNDALTWALLLAGGALVGFGTQMAGGCTSGHGLSGASRLVPASLIATASFFGTAAAVSLLIGMV